jgi:undecaprenyl-diphosphatase
VSRARPDQVALYLDKLDRLEIRWVERQNRLTRRSSLRYLALTISRGGNGGMYLVLAFALLSVGTAGARVVMAAAVSGLAAHAIYPLAKSFVARPRPFARYESVEAVGSPLDLYSFPSGHCMTAAAVFTALGTAFPLSIPFAVAAVLLLAWARLACAHHYPSDLLCGVALGVAVAVPVSHLLLR